LKEMKTQPLLTAILLAFTAQLLTDQALAQTAEQSGELLGSSAGKLPALAGKFGSAYARVENNQLVVGTGRVERR
jgi:hypothetical protein